MDFPPRLQLSVARLVDVKPEELSALLWSFAYFFCLLAGYYVLRPLRDEMGIVGGVRNLQWLFTATFMVMLAAVPLFGAIVARLPRRRFIPLVYHFFAINIAIFWLLLLRSDVFPVQVARIFFVWISVFNLFAVSVFWSFMADLFNSEQGKRLFGFIAAGGSAGALLGPGITLVLAGPLGPVNLLIVAGLLLELAVFCVGRLERATTNAGSQNKGPADRAGSVGGGALAGFLMLLRSPYLAGIALWVLLLSLAGTFLYFMQADIVASTSNDPAVRTRIFATIDLIVGVLTLLIQSSVTGKLMSRFGVTPAVAFLPLVFALGFALLASNPVLVTLIAFQAAQRTANFAISNPAREVLFTVVAREEKYKAKYVIDGVIFRAADALSGWAFTMLRGLSLDTSLIAYCTVPVAAGWFFLSLVLGKVHERRALARKAGDGL